VVLFVKIIYGTGIGNDVMDVVELDDFKLLYIEIIKGSAIVVISSKKELIL
jgi:hypothetical protein